MTSTPSLSVPIVRFDSLLNSIGDSPGSGRELGGTPGLLVHQLGEPAPEETRQQEWPGLGPRPLLCQVMATLQVAECGVERER